MQLLDLCICGLKAGFNFGKLILPNLLAFGKVRRDTRGGSGAVAMVVLRIFNQLCRFMMETLQSMDEIIFQFCTGLNCQ